jgi:hypothetical protein
MHRDELKSKGRATKDGATKSHGMAQNSRAERWNGTASQRTGMLRKGIAGRSKGIALEARMSNGITRQFIDASGQAKEMKCGGLIRRCAAKRAERRNQKIKTKRRKQHAGNQSKINIHGGNSWNSGGR